MSDLVFGGMLVGLFGLAAMFVRACGRIVGPEEGTSVPASTDDAGEAAA